MTLHLEAIEIHLHGQRLLGPLSASVAPGEVLAVMGASGSGKSSLLAHVAGLLEPPLAGRGAIRVDDLDLTHLPIEQRRVGLLFQDDLLFPHLTVEQNLLFALPASSAGGRASRSERVTRINEALAQAELPGLGQRLPAQLSGGQRSRISLLRALLAGPRVLLLDEPFARLDMALRDRMRAHTWATLRAHGVPALLVTHDAADIPAGAAVFQIEPPRDA